MFPFLPMHLTFGSASPTEPVVTVEGEVGSDVDVPCSVFPADAKDKVNLILWYKDNNEVPIYR